MNYKVNPDSLSAVFMVPSQIVDKHIKLAGGQQLRFCFGRCAMRARALIWKSCAGISIFSPRRAGLSQYWVETGILVSDGTADSAFAPVVSEKNAEPPKAKKELPDIEPSRPTAAEIAQRAEESADIKFLLLETQNKLGRTIGYDGQCTLLMMHDTYGIPVEVILMIIEYAVSI